LLFANHLHKLKIQRIVRPALLKGANPTPGCVSDLISASRTLVTSSHELGVPYLYICSSLRDASRTHGHAHGKIRYGSKTGQRIPLCN
jgi:hypothetical protein